MRHDTAMDSPTAYSESSATSLSASGRELRDEIRQWPEQRVFFDNHIRGDCLLDCDMRVLRDMGVNVVGDRVRISNAIKALRARCLDNSAKTIHSFKSPVYDRAPNSAYSPVVQNMKDRLYSDGAGRYSPTSGSPRRTSNSDQLASPSKTQPKSSFVKFISAEGETRSVTADADEDLPSVLAKAMKRFNIDPKVYEPCVYVTTDDMVIRLRDEEFRAVLADPLRPERGRLILGNTTEKPGPAEIQRSLQITRSQQPQSVKGESERHNAIPERIDRLGEIFGERRTPTQQPSSDSAGAKSATKRRKPIKTIKEFFGQRPPSEMISSNLAEYFPDHGPDVLEQTVRNSIRFSRRLSKLGPLPGRRSSVMTAASGVSGNKEPFQLPNIGEAWLNHGAPVPSRRSSKVLTAKNAGNIPSEVNSIYSVPRRSVAGEIQEEEEEKRSEESEAESGRKGYPNQQALPQETIEDSDTASATLGADPLADQPATDSGEEDDSEEIGSLGDESISIKWIKGALIGSGSFGEVFLGMNSMNGELMAVKLVELQNKANPEVESRKKSMLDALQHEIVLLRELSHPNIVQYIGSQSDGEHLHIFLEYVPGGSVTALLNNYGAFEEPLVKNFVRQIVQGLQYLHQQDIVHRDIKGANILVDNKGGVKISDFGISKKVETNLMSIQANDNDNRFSLQGSVFWMAPEVVKQTSYTPKADVWSLGCLIVEMFTGQHPFPKFNQMQALFKIGTRSAPEIPQHVSDAAKDFLAKTFEFEQDLRPTAEELLAHPFLEITAS